MSSTISLRQRAKRSGVSLPKYDDLSATPSLAVRIFETQAVKSQQETAWLTQAAEILHDAFGWSRAGLK
ncbi:hypothetical protein CYMTET_19510, partial [Cymbomonas tetramitiformis]